MITLSEAASKARLARYGIPVVPDALCDDPTAAVAAAEAFGYPVVAKLNGDGLAHKSERGLVHLGLGDADSVQTAARELLAAARPEHGPVAVLVAPMLRGLRELIAGIHRDRQFGPCVMVGMGGVLAEALGRVDFRLVPIEPIDALEMTEGLDRGSLLGGLRGEPPLERDALAAILLGLNAMAEAEPDVVSVDVNPLIVVDGRPVAADALVEVTGASVSEADTPPTSERGPSGPASKPPGVG